MFVSQVMQLGFYPALVHFQHIMHKTLDGNVLEIACPGHATYINDVNLHGICWVRVMRDSLCMVARMAAKCLPLGSDKCYCLTNKPVVLGYKVDGPRGEYRAGPKSLKQLLGASLPWSLKEL